MSKDKLVNIIFNPKDIELHIKGLDYYFNQKNISPYERICILKMYIEFLQFSYGIKSIKDKGFL